MIENIPGQHSIREVLVCYISFCLVLFLLLVVCLASIYSLVLILLSNAIQSIIFSHIYSIFAIASQLISNLVN